MPSSKTPRIAVVTMGVKLGTETRGYTRFLSVCQALRAAGFDVDLITSSFQHWDKQQRDVHTFPYQMHDFGIVFINEPGYRRNVDPRRLASHAQAARNLTDYLESGPHYDLIYAEVPPNDVALAAARFAQRRGIPFVADINDLWPEAMRMVLDIPLVSDVLFSKLASDARALYRLLSGVVGTSDEYATRPFTNCDQSIERITVYVGNDLDAFDAGVQEFSGQIQKPQGEFWVTYAGTLGTSYDLETLIRSCALLQARGMNDVKVIVLGDGPDAQRLRSIASERKANVQFVGYAEYPKMAAYLAASDITVNSLVRKAPQSIVTKIGDYLAAGCPMINTGSNREFRAKVTRDGFGVNVVAEDARALADAIATLHDDPQKREEMGRIAREVAQREFDRKHSYTRIVELVQRLLQA